MSQRHLSDHVLAALAEGRLDEPEAGHHYEAFSAEPRAKALLDTLFFLEGLEAAGGAQLDETPVAARRAAQALWPERAVRQGLARLVVAWVGEGLRALAEGLSPEMSPAIALRGDSAEAPDVLSWRVIAGPVPLAIDLEVEDEDTVCLRIRPEAPPPAGTLLRLAEADRTRALSTLSMAGATVSALSVGRYAITLERDRQEIARVDLDLRPC